MPYQSTPCKRPPLYRPSYYPLDHPMPYGPALFPGEPVLEKLGLQILVIFFKTAAEEEDDLETKDGGIQMLLRRLVLRYFFRTSSFLPSSLRTLNG
jgi:hypothetical protein